MTTAISDKLKILGFELYTFPEPTLMSYMGVPRTQSQRFFCVFKNVMLRIENLVDKVC